MPLTKSVINIAAEATAAGFLLLLLAACLMQKRKDRHHACALCVNVLFYNVTITNKGVVSLKEKRYVPLSDHERRIIVLSLNRLRNRVIADGIEPIDVDRMLLKMARLNKKRFGGA